MAGNDCSSPEVSPNKSAVNPSENDLERGIGVAVRVRGARHRIKLGPVKVLDKREARVIADERIKELLMPKPPEPPPQKGAMPFKEFAAEFAEWAAETKIGWARYRGKKLEETALRHAGTFFGDMPLREITREHVKDFSLVVARRRIAGRPVKNRTINAELRQLRHLFYMAIEWGKADANPVAEYKFADEDRQKAPSRILETDEQARFLAALPAWLRLLVEFNLQNGARRGDLVKLAWKQVHSDYVEFVETKEGRARVVPLNSRALEILALLRPPGVKPDVYVFEPGVDRNKLVARIRREWKRAVKRAAIAPIRFHDMRHTVGTRLCREGTDLRTVQGILGHASLKTTERYLKQSDKLKQAAAEKLAAIGRGLATVPETPVQEIPVTARIQ